MADVRKRGGKGSGKGGKGKKSAKSGGNGGGDSASSRGLVVSCAIIVAAAVLAWVALSGTLSKGGGVGDAARKAKSAADPNRPFDPDRIDQNDDHLPDPLEVLQEKFNVTMLSTDPPVYQFEDFLTDKEADGLVRLASGRFHRSTTGLNRDKTDLSRTSSTAWLIDNAHYSNKMIQQIERRMAAAMNVPPGNQEGFQVLEYQVGEYYREHHDYLPEMETWPCDARLATFFLYLSDVEEGGGTWFPRLNLTGVPKKRRALLWYNVKRGPSGQWIMDGRTQHEAVPVKRGKKYAANKWVHLKDWVTPWRAGKTG